MSLALCKVASVPCSPSIVYVFQLSLYNTRDSLWIPSLYLSGAVLNCWFTTLVFKYSNNITNTKESLLNTRQRYVCKLDNSAAITLWNKTKTEWLTKKKKKKKKRKKKEVMSQLLTSVFSSRAFCSLMRWLLRPVPDFSLAYILLLRSGKLRFRSTPLALERPFSQLTVPFAWNNKAAFNANPKHSFTTSESGACSVFLIQT